MRAAKAERIRAGLYSIRSVRCRDCGGELRVERCGSRGDFLWEIFCRQCGVCDPDGWPTLREAVLEANRFNSPETLEVE